MDFKFKDGDKKTKDEAVENEVPENEAFEYETVEDEGQQQTEATQSEAPGYDYGEQAREENKVEESVALEPYVPESEAEANDLMESEGPGIAVGGGGTVEGEAADTRPKYRIPTEKEDVARNSFKFPLKQILLVVILLGGGYYVKTYHGKENKPTRIANPPAAEIQNPTPKVSSLEEIPGLLNESKELFRSIKEQENRRKNQASARRSSGNASPRQINLQALKNYKGQWVTILMKDGLQREGRIVDVKEKIVHLEQDYDYGTISVRVPIQNIADVRE
ncbi:MAG: hypothetical protein VST67_04010 [Nitrospirota bacterium]|nr:hypothetical protein [Nitrospirota bacterium]